jgi:hypothetical protein
MRDESSRRMGEERTDLIEHLTNAHCCMAERSGSLVVHRLPLESLLWGFRWIFIDAWR